MTSHDKIVRAVEEYFQSLPLGRDDRTIKTEEPIQFGAKVGGYADVVLLSGPRFVAIAECKNPWDNVDSARAQLKAYLCATGTQFGILAIGMDSENWVFCENKGNYYFIEITETVFGESVAAWSPNNDFRYSEETARQWESTARQHRESINIWQSIAVALGISVRQHRKLINIWRSIAVVLGISVAFLITRFVMIPPPEPILPGPEMAMIPAGEFQMGSNDTEADDDEQPVRMIYLDTFYIDRYEVTNAQYKQFVDANPLWQKDRIPSEYHDGDYLKHWEGNNYPESKENHPVVYISWYAAMAYAEWAGKRLPTEAEWEKAARGGLVEKAYPWGNSIDPSKANYSAEIEDTTSVGNYSANAYGLYDMAGNAWEWCLDLYETDFYDRSPLRNPVAGESLTKITETFRAVHSPRVLRGGYWNNPPVFVRVADRYKQYPGSTHRGSGFRCVMGSP